MPHFVFANGNEIATKSADGASIACQPDVCFSPGAPMPGVPVPYPNSVFARDLDNLSRTVFIKGTGAAREDKSYFSTSYGDEPATPGLKKGAISGKIQGRAYFKSWSMDVKFEGAGVARHMDTVTHNHANPTNALVQKYRSIWAKDRSCVKNRDDVAKKCKKKPAEKKPKRKGLLQKLKKITSLPDEMAKEAYLYKKKDANAWIDDYCDGLWIKPQSGLERFEKAKATIDKFLSQDKWSLAQSAFGELMELAKQQLGPGFLLKKAGGLALRSLLKEGGAVVMGATGIGLVVSAGLTAWTVADVIATATEIAGAIGPEGLAILEDLKVLDTIEQKLKNTLKQWQEDPSTLMAELMRGLAMADSCLRARKCMLVPFSRTSRAAEAANSGEGCCPGQTGHHLIYDSWMDGAGCKNYDRDTAPTVCVEGTDQRHGSHGAIHDATDRRIKGALGRKPPSMKLDSKGRMSYEDAKKRALDAFKEIFWNSGCSLACLKKQLDEYYKNACGGKEPTLRPTDKGGNPYVDGSSPKSGSKR